MIARVLAWWRIERWAFAAATACAVIAVFAAALMVLFWPVLKFFFALYLVGCCFRFAWFVAWPLHKKHCDLTGSRCLNRF